MDLAIRYMLVGIVMNFIGGWITDFTTAYVSNKLAYLGVKPLICPHVTVKKFRSSHSVKLK